MARSDAPNDPLWRATSVWAQGRAQPGAQLPGVEIRKIAVLQVYRIAEFKADIAPIPIAMLYPCRFEEACSIAQNKAKLPASALQEKGCAVWYQGRMACRARMDGHCVQEHCR